MTAATDKTKSGKELVSVKEWRAIAELAKVKGVTTSWIERRLTVDVETLDSTAV